MTNVLAGLLLEYTWNMQFEFQAQACVVVIVHYNYENGYGASEDDVYASALPFIMVPVRLSLMTSILSVSFS